jgi:hypothetical protein
VAKRDEKPWQFNVSFGLVMLVMVLILGYFYGSAVKIREMRPVEVAVERLKEQPSPGAGNSVEP